MRRLAALAVSLAILALVWWHVDARAIAAAFAAADPVWLGIGLGAVIPLTLGTAWRFSLLSRSPIRLGSATRLILSSSTLNLFLPSKMGDLAKAWVLTGRYGFEGSRAFALVVMEKILDLAALLFWGVLALLWIGGGDPLLILAAAATAGLLLLLVLLLSPWPLLPALLRVFGGLLPARLGAAATAFGGQWNEATSWLWRDPGRAALVVAVSLALWAGHLVQFWLFASALAFVPLIDNMAFATLAILAGLLPFTMAGIGTRDAAIIALYGGWLNPGQGAVLGVLATSRYLIPALAGLLFVGDYWRRRAPVRS